VPPALATCGLALTAAIANTRVGEPFLFALFAFVWLICSILSVIIGVWILRKRTMVGVFNIILGGLLLCAALILFPES